MSNFKTRVTSDQIPAMCHFWIVKEKSSVLGKVNNNLKVSNFSSLGNKKTNWN